MISEWTFAPIDPPLPSYWTGASSPVIAADNGPGTLQAYTQTIPAEGSWRHDLGTSATSDGTGSLQAALLSSRTASIEVTVSTLGHSGIQLSGDFSRVGNPSFDPWSLAYSLDGGQSFTGFSPTAGSWNYGWNHIVWDMSSVTGLDNQNSVEFRLGVHAISTAAGYYMSGNVDNLVVSSSSATMTPEPSSLALLGIGGLTLLGYRSRRRTRRSGQQA